MVTTKYSEMLDYVASLDVGVGETLRTSCPECGHRAKNSFTVTNSGGTVKWNCYSNSCAIGGGTSRVRTSRQDTLDRLYSLMGVEVDKKERRPVEICESFTPLTSLGHQSKAVYQYLYDNHVMESYRQGKIDVMYDVAQSRVVFIQPQVMIGRYVPCGSLRAGKAPKWYKYTKERVPIAVQSLNQDCGGNTVVIVEDAASACSCSRVVDSLALLGTNFFPEYREYIENYDNVVVALDRDAAKKGGQIARYLDTFGYRVTNKVLDTDIKTWDIDRVTEEFGE